VNSESGLFGRLKCQWLDTNSHVFSFPPSEVLIGRIPS